jgi:hypothetical protein
MNPLSRLAHVGRIASLVTLALFIPLAAEAAVHKEGTWPASDKKVSFEFDGKPSDGLAKLAEEAGWSLVMSKGITVSEHDVKINVEDQPADAVLDALFAESDVVARRNGTLITITAAPGSPAPGTAPPSPASPAGVTAPAPPTPPTAPTPPAAVDGVPSIPPVPPVPTVRGEDRNILGNSLVVGKDEIVHTVTVTGGSAKIYGTVTGDLVVAGGSARIEEGGRVVGNATVFGGSLKVVSGARVDGDVGIVGGALKREEGAIIGGKVVDSANGQHGDVKVTMHDGEVSTEVKGDRKRASGRGRLTEAVHSFGQSVTNMSLLFVFGCVLLALGTRKMETLRVEAAARPMKSFAMGIVGSFCALIALVAMCVTLVGIPFAVLLLLLGLFSVYASIAAVLTMVGAAVAGHKSTNPYVHLLVGCVLFLLSGLVPYIGGLVTAAVVLIAIGTLVTTRLAGIVDKRTRKPDLV